MGYKIRKLDIRTRKQVIEEFGRIGATPPGKVIMSNKVFPVALKIKNINPVAADILKQEMLSRMGDVVTSRDTLTKSEEATDVIIIGTEKAITSLAEKIKMQQFGLPELSDNITSFLAYLKESKTRKSLNITGKEFDLSKEGALIMGILNVTPDSFYDGGKYYLKEDAIKRAEMIAAEGAQIIDIGGMSSRPGSKPVPPEEEIKRIIPLVEYIKKNLDILVSVDTCRSYTAARAIETGADIINDISGMTFDEGIFDVVKGSHASIVIMHMQGTPETMQVDPKYSDVVEEIYDFLFAQAQKAIEKGIDKSRIIIDPGIGFGKKLEHNLEIIAKLSDLANMGFPVLLGTSRKSFIGMVLDDAPADDRLEGSIISAIYGFLNGAEILRVHDVSQTLKALKVAKSIRDRL